MKRSLLSEKLVQGQNVQITMVTSSIYDSVVAMHIEKEEVWGKSCVNDLGEGGGQAPFDTVGAGTDGRR